MMSPELTQLATQLAQAVAKNAAGAVFSKITAMRARKLDQDVMNELVELVNDLIADKNELIAIAQGFEQELVAQQISDGDLTYITTKLMPLVEQFAVLADDEKSAEMVDIVKGLVTKETMTILQLVGFNFRRAIGEPLTTMLERTLLSKVPDRGLAELQLRRETAYFEALADPDAREVLRQFGGSE